MTRIERVDVEGFKGIESLALEPSGINIVTGRNNTGKTSLLEAIQLAFYPGAVGGFGENVDRIVNANHDQSTIYVEMDSGTRVVNIGAPTPEQTEEILMNAVFNATQEFFRHLFDRSDSDDISNVTNSILTQELHLVISDEISDELTEKCRSEIILVEVDNQEYQFVSGKDAVSDLYWNVIDEVISRIENRCDISVGFRPSFNENIFVNDRPPSIDTTTIVDIPDLTTPPTPKDDETDAIKVDDIEDFLIENEILENLRDFDLDYLVFENKDGDKYSVPYEFMGDGFNAIVGVLWELLADDLAGNVVLLEEPGTHMHPGYVRELVYFLVNLAREEGVQLFVTTHDNDFISDFFTENLTDEEREFLHEEFTLVQMQEDAADVMGYEEAEAQLKDLHLDLRGL